MSGTKTFTGLLQKRIELGVSVGRLVKIIGRHPSYVHEVEAERIPLVWEVNAELIGAL